MKLQSAMEYLMTYGWAILIIAVVLGAIYSLGLFNASTLGPRTQPGSCQVIRPGGPMTTSYISLAGSCTNQLPAFTATFCSGRCYVSTGGNMITTNLYNTGQVTMSAWIYLGNGPSNTIFGDSGSGRFQLASYGTGAATTLFGGGSWIFSPNTLSTGKWYMVTGTGSNGGLETLYINGVAVNSIISGSSTLLAAPITIGWGNPTSGGACVSCFGGQIADVQIYNATLDANQIMALYIQGIGGAPINLQNLVGWWPLNGNPYDYSGNVNNGAQFNVIYTNQWISGYTVP